MWSVLNHQFLFRGHSLLFCNLRCFLSKIPCVCSSTQSLCTHAQLKLHSLVLNAKKPHGPKQSIRPYHHLVAILTSQIAHQGYFHYSVPNFFRGIEAICLENLLDINVF